MINRLLICNFKDIILLERKICIIIIIGQLICWMLLLLSTSMSICNLSFQCKSSVYIVNTPFSTLSSQSQSTVWIPRVSRILGQGERKAKGLNWSLPTNFTKLLNKTVINKGISSHLWFWALTIIIFKRFHKQKKSTKKK